ncbi:MAG: metalloregulator ArsR/SmtB family transcription factor [bacterium]
MTAKPDARLVKMFKALGNPNRFQLFTEMLRARASGVGYQPDASCSLTAIVERLSIGAPTVSHHMKELVNADLVRTERDGKFLRCEVNEEALEALQAFFTGATPARS